MSSLSHRLTCQCCGATFTAGRRDAKTCGEVCRQRLARGAGTTSSPLSTSAGDGPTPTPTTRTLFDVLDQPTELERVIDALRKEWPELRPWIRDMLMRLARKRKCTSIGE